MSTLTQEEKAAIAALRRLEKRWPKTLTLVHHTDSTFISVKKPSAHPSIKDDDLANVPSVASVKIPIETVA